MKKLALLIFAIACLSLLADSQEKIEGVYKFKPGVTTISVIGEIEKELKVKTDEVSSTMDYYTKITPKVKVFTGKVTGRKVILRLININTLPKTKEYSYDYVSYSPYDLVNKAYYISSIDASGIELAEIYLFFRNDTLTKMQCGHSKEIESALSAKYGDPALTKDEKTINCTYKLTGNTVEEKEQTFTSTWSNDKILAESIIGSYFDAKCQKQFLSYFAIQNTDLHTRYITSDLEMETSIKETIEKRNKENLKGTLKDF
jgi:hypothetical protein